MKHIRTYQLFEAAKEFMELGPNVGIVLDDKRKILCIFDFKSETCIGMICLMEKKDGVWSVNMSAADKGYGPMIYKAAIMSVYPGTVRPYMSRAITDDATNIWKRFYIDSKEIKKTIIKSGDRSWYNYDNEQLDIILNTKYSRPKSTWYKKFVIKGQELVKKNGISINDISLISLDYFSKKYQ